MNCCNVQLVIFQIHFLKGPGDVDPSKTLTDLCLVLIKYLNKIENPEYPDRDQWVYDIGYKQWTNEEIINGTVFKRFKEKLGL